MRWFLPLFLCTAAALGAETFHVSPQGSDKGSGRRGSPWRTLERALEDRRLGPGDVVVVAPGTYDGPVKIVRGGAWRRPVILRGEPGAILRNPEPGPVVRIQTRDPIVLEGFTIRPSAGLGVLVSQSGPGTVLRRLHIEGGGAEGIRIEDSRGVRVERSSVQASRYGVVIEGRGHLIINNKITSCTVAGIVLGGEEPVRDSTVRGNSLLENGGGHGDPGGLWVRWVRDVRFENNLLQSKGGRRLLTVESDGVAFSNNHFFSPNDAHGAAYFWAGFERTGFGRLRILMRDPNAMFADPATTAEGLHPGSPAIDAGGGRPAPGEMDFKGGARVVGMAPDVGAYEFALPAGLRVEGNQLMAQNRIVRLRGVAVGDPFLDRQGRPLSDYAALRDLWNANVVRISVHANVWRDANEFGGREEVLRRLRGEVDAALGAGLYVILDWHVVGWPDGYAKPSEPGEPVALHDTRFALAKSFWESVARTFGKDGRILFELWNEPVRGPDDWKPDPRAWEDLRPYFEHLTGVVRAHSENVVIVAGGSWAYSLQGIRDNPPADLNTAIAWHIYAGKENNDERRWEAAFDDLAKDFPVIVSEWGFEEGGPAHYRGDIEDFGAKFSRRWLEGRSLHWVAWCWHPEVGPPMLQKDGASPTAFGAFVAGLLKQNPPRSVTVPRWISPEGRPVRFYRPFSID